MSGRLHIGFFEDDRDLLDAARECRERKIPIMDVISPYPIHGLDPVLGIRRSYLAWVTLAGGAVGLALGFWLEYWTSAVNWPLNVGGRPFDSLPAFIPVAFELTILIAGLSTALFLLVRSRLWPGKQPELGFELTTDDRSALILSERDAAFRGEDFTELLVRHGAVDLREEQGGTTVNRTFGYLLVALVVGGLVYGLQAMTTPDLERRNLEIFTEMKYSEAYESFTASPELPGGTTQQALVAGVVPRGQLPLGFEGGTEEAARAGREGPASPFEPGEPEALARGSALFGTYCALCHGVGGDGDGEVVLHGMLPPPSLHGARATAMPDGEMFHILTFGQGNMASYAAQLSREERWKVILHVRQLQQEQRQ